MDPDLLEVVHQVGEWSLASHEEGCEPHVYHNAGKDLEECLEAEDPRPHIAQRCVSLNCGLCFILVQSLGFVIIRRTLPHKCQLL